MGEIASMRKILALLSYSFRYLKFYVKSVTIYDLDAPFVVQFVQEVIFDKRYFRAFDFIEAQRKQLLQNQHAIRVTDYGAGSKVARTQVRQIRDIAKHSAISPKTGQWLFKTVLFAKPRHILELGTSLGISALYLGTARKQTNVITLEGCPQTAEQATRTILQTGTQHIEVRQGRFSDTLEVALNDIETLDLLYVDGDHRLQPTLEYVEKCLTKAHSRSVFILADIHWSSEMEQAWEILSKHTQVRLAIDVFDVGFLFFDERILNYQYYAMVPWQWKPWHLGIIR